MHGHNKSFESDPFAYVSKYAINHITMKVYGEKDAHDFDEAPRYSADGRIVAGAYSAYNRGVNQAKAAIEVAKLGSFDLEPVAQQGGAAIYLRFVVPGQYAPAAAEYGGAARGADPALSAYWLGYLMPGLQGSGKAKIPFVDLPKAGPAHRLMLTGAMNGCSMVVTLHPTDPTLLRVYHDSCHGKDTFKDDVVIARIDYTDEGYASANAKVVAPAPVVAPLVRPRSGSVGAAPAVHDSAPVLRERSGSIGAAPLAPAPCIRTSYGDLAQYSAVAASAGSGSAGTSVKVRSSFNFLYYDAGLSHWVAVSQPLETQPAVAQPVQGWFESEATFKARRKAHQRRGIHVAMPPTSPPWHATIPY